MEQADFKKNEASRYYLQQLFWKNAQHLKGIAHLGQS